MRIAAYLLATASLLAQAACSTNDAEQPASDTDSFATLAIEGAPPAAELPGRVRVVNLWVADGAPGAIDVHVSQGRETVPLFTGVDFGSATAYAAVEADAVLYAYRSDGATRDRSPADAVGTAMLRSDLESGHPLTVTFRYAKPLRDNGPSAVANAFKDAGDFVSGSMPVRPVEGALLVTDVSAANAASGVRETYYFGFPGQGCLLPAGSSSATGRTSLGGTGTAEYDVPPGQSRVAAYATDDPQCERAPILGPVEIDAARDRRNYLFAYGTDRSDRRLLFVSAPATP